MEVKSRRVGGANYQVPVQVREDRRVALSMRWIIQFARKRSGSTMREKLAAELIEAANERGNAFKNVRTLIVWLKQTKHSLTIVGNHSDYSLPVYLQTGNTTLSAFSAVSRFWGAT